MRETTLLLAIVILAVAGWLVVLAHDIRRDQRTLLRILDRRDAVREPTVAEVWSQEERERRLHETVDGAVAEAFARVTGTTIHMDEALLAAIEHGQAGRGKTWDF